MHVQHLCPGPWACHVRKMVLYSACLSINQSAFIQDVDDCVAVDVLGMFKCSHVQVSYSQPRSVGIGLLGGTRLEGHGVHYCTHHLSCSLHITFTTTCIWQCQGHILGRVGRWGSTPTPGSWHNDTLKLSGSNFLART